MYYLVLVAGGSAGDALLRQTTKARTIEDDDNKGCLVVISVNLGNFLQLSALKMNKLIILTMYTIIVVNV